MPLSIRRALTIAVLVAALAPATLLAQTPEPVTSESTQAVVQTDLGVSRVEGTELVHAVTRLDIAPGAPIGPLINMTSVVLTVQEGQLLVTSEGGRSSVGVGTGDAVRTADGEVVCERSLCLLETDDPVVIGAGNGFLISGGSINMEVGDEPVVVIVSLVIPESALEGRCWICPVIIP